jgi:hypothetical protein
MLTYDDCVGLCNLSEEEIEAIAMHEHIPQIAALELGNYLLCGTDGIPRIKRIIIDDIEHAERQQDKQRELQLKLVLKHFIDTHPENPAR